MNFHIITSIIILGAAFANASKWIAALGEDTNLKIEYIMVVGPENGRNIIRVSATLEISKSGLVDTLLEFSADEVGVLVTPTQWLVSLGEQNVTHLRWLERVNSIKIEPEALANPKLYCPNHYADGVYLLSVKELQEEDTYKKFTLKATHKSVRCMNTDVDAYIVKFKGNLCAQVWMQGINVDDYTFVLVKNHKNLEISFLSKNQRGLIRVKLLEPGNPSTL